MLVGANIVPNFFQNNDLETVVSAQSNEQGSVESSSRGGSLVQPVQSTSSTSFSSLKDEIQSRMEKQDDEIVYRLTDEEINQVSEIISLIEDEEIKNEISDIFTNSRTRDNTLPLNSLKNMTKLLYEYVSNMHARSPVTDPPIRNDRNNRADAQRSGTSTIYTGPFDYDWEDEFGLAALAEGYAAANKDTTGCAAYTSAWIGGINGEGCVRVWFYLGSRKTVTIRGRTKTVGGNFNIPPASVAGAYNSLWLNGDTDKYYKEEIDSPFSVEWFLDVFKYFLDMVCMACGGCCTTGSGAVDLLIDVLDNAGDLLGVISAVNQLVDSEIHSITKTFTLSPGWHYVDLGIRSTSSGCVVGLGNNGRSGRFVDVKITGIAHPDNPTVTGPSSGQTDVSYSFSAKSVDPNGDDVQYKWDFGDGTTTGWSGWYSSGSTQWKTHSFSDIQSYQVKVKTRDRDQMESDWTIHQFSVGNTPPVLSTVSGWNDGVNPNTGTVNDDFSFKVHYSDADGQNPVTRNVVIDGTSYSMTGSGSNSDYSVVKSGNALGLGEHSYYFEFYDPYNGLGRLPASGSWSFVVEALPEPGDPYYTFSTVGLSDLERRTDGWTGDPNFCDFWIPYTVETTMVKGEVQASIQNNDVIKIKNALWNPYIEDWYYTDHFHSDDDQWTYYEYSIANQDSSEYLVYNYDYGNIDAVINVRNGKLFFDNDPPITPTTPSGVSSGKPDVQYSYSSMTSDPDDDDVFYWFSWGDGSSTGWMGPYSDQQMVSATHRWNIPGVYSVRVRSKDIHDQRSSWSSVRTVTITSDPPGKPVSPVGPSSGILDTSYAYTSSTNDPDGDDVFYWFDWGDGSNSGWLGPYPSDNQVFQETFYFDDYLLGSEWTNPERMTDGNTDSYASASGPLSTQVLNSTSFQGNYNGIITRVELRPKAYADMTGFLTLQPVFDGSVGETHPYTLYSPGFESWVDITDDISAPDQWSWDDIETLDCTVTGTPGLWGEVFCGKVEIRVSYIDAVESSVPHATHTWTDSGVFDVRVKAKDVYGSESSWSPYKSVGISAGLPTVLTNMSSDVGESSAMFHGYLFEDGGEPCSVWFDYWTPGESNISTSTYTLSEGSSFDVEVSGLTPGSLYYYKACANNSAESVVSANTSFLTRPGNLSLFSADAVDHATIQLSWTDGLGGDGVYVEYSNVSDSTWMPGDHIPVSWNGYLSSSPFNHTGLNADTTYYYKAWAYAEDNGFKSDGTQTRPFANNPKTTNVLIPDTNLPTVETIPASNVNETSVIFHGLLIEDEGENCTVGFEYGKDSVVHSDSYYQGSTTRSLYEGYINRSGERYYDFVGTPLNVTFDIYKYGNPIGFNVYGRIRYVNNDSIACEVVKNVSDDSIGFFYFDSAPFFDHEDIYVSIEVDGGNNTDCIALKNNGNPNGENNRNSYYYNGDYYHDYNINVNYTWIGPRQVTLIETHQSGDNFSKSVDGLMPGVLYFYRSFANNSEKKGFGLYETYLTKPKPLINFQITSINLFTTHLSWLNQEGSDGAYIEYSTVNDSTWMPGDHNKVDDDGYVTSPFNHTDLQDNTTYYYRAWAYAEDDNISSDGSSTRPFGDKPKIEKITTFPVLPPNVTTNISTGIGRFNATLNGFLIDDGGEPCDIWFEWGKTTSYGNTTNHLIHREKDQESNVVHTGYPVQNFPNAWDENWNSCAKAEAIGCNSNINGWAKENISLPPTVENNSLKWTFKYRLEVNYYYGTKSDADIWVYYWNYDTSSWSQIYHRACSSEVEQETITKNIPAAALSDNNTVSIKTNLRAKAEYSHCLQAFAYYYEGKLSFDAGYESPYCFSDELTNLEPLVTYHYRAVANNSRDTIYGPDQYFDTSGATPNVSTMPVTEVGGQTAEIHGYIIDAGGELCEVWFEYGNNTNYTNDTHYWEDKSEDDTEDGKDESGWQSGVNNMWDEDWNSRAYFGTGSGGFRQEWVIDEYDNVNGLNFNLFEDIRIRSKGEVVANFLALNDLAQVEFYYWNYNSESWTKFYDTGYITDTTTIDKNRWLGKDAFKNGSPMKIKILYTGQATHGNGYWWIYHYEMKISDIKTPYHDKTTNDSFSYNLTSLNFGTTYHYRALAKNLSGIGYGINKTFLTKPNPLTSFSSIANQSQVQLSWNDGTGGDGAYIEYSTVNDSTWMPGDHNKVDDDGYVTSPFNHTDLQDNTTYYYRAWAYAEDDNISSDGSSTRPFGDNPKISSVYVFGSAPIVGNENHSNVDETHADVNGSLLDDGGDERSIKNCSVWFEWSTDTSFDKTTTKHNVSAGAIINENISKNMKSVTVFAENIIGGANPKVFGNETLVGQQFMIKQGETHQIRGIDVRLHPQDNTTWCKLELYKVINGTPTGTLIGLSILDNVSLWNTSFEWHSFMFDTPILLFENKTYVFVLSTDGQLYYESNPENAYHEGSMISSWDNGTNWAVWSNGKDMVFREYGRHHVTPGTRYYYRIAARNSVGISYGTNTIRGHNNTFLTKPMGPLDLNIVSMGIHSVNLSWNKGTGANTTVIVRNHVDYPSHPYDGTVVYNGTGMNKVDTGLSSNTMYYYRAWSFASWDDHSSWSDMYSECMEITNATNYSPSITNISTNPSVQLMNGFVNITCILTDDHGINTVKANISSAQQSMNSSMQQYQNTDLFYLNQTYATAGAYTYTIFVNDTDGNLNISSVHTFIINTGLTADFGYPIGNHTTYDFIQFNDTSYDVNGSIDSWYWEFGDNTSSNLRDPVHQYEDNGTYLVNLTVTDDDSARSNVSKTIIIDNQKPTAGIMIPPMDLVVNETIYFSDVSMDGDGTVVNWSWSFGDGTNSFDQHPTHIYQTAGDYMIYLNITDDDGAVNSTFTTLSISSKMISVNISLVEEWNLVSIPLNESMNKNSIQVMYDQMNHTWTEAVNDGIILDFVYGWNSSGQTYETTDILEPGDGYWIYAYNNSNLWVSGSRDDEDDFITDLSVEWNLIGLPSDEPVAKENLTVMFNGTIYNWSDAVFNNIVLDFIYGWNASGQTYETTELLLTGKAYWLYAYENCRLNRSN